MAKPEITGRQITAARALLGLHQAQVAEETHCTRTSISMIEGGRKLPAKERVVAYLEKLGIRFVRGGVRL